MTGVDDNDDADFVSRGVVTTTTANTLSNDPNIVVVNHHHHHHGMKQQQQQVDQDSVEDGIMKLPPRENMTSRDISTFECRTTFQIASSSSSTPQQALYTRRQRYGATLLSYGSLVLLVGMTLESIVLQSQSWLYMNHAKYDLYKWGLHLSVMFTFCTVMCVNVGLDNYERYSRPILLLACPAGSLVAAYQWYDLILGNQTDILSITVRWLFVIRCVCGIVQTGGAYLLNTLQQHHHHHHHQCATTLSLSSSSSANDDDEDGDHDLGTDSSDEEHHDTDEATTVVSFVAEPTTNHHQPIHQRRLLRDLHARINILLYYLFIPIMIVFIALSVSRHEQPDACFVEPNLSPMIPSTMSFSCSDNMSNSTTSMSDNSNKGGGMGFMLMPNIPGLGMYFHFGLVLLLFIYDGIQRTVPTYTPSLFLATVSAYHLAILLGTDLLVWDVLQTQWYTSTSLTNMEIVQRIVQLLWSMVSGYLAYSLHQFWNLRVTALHEI